MKLSLFFALLVFQLGFSQQRTCKSNSHMQKLMTDPVAKQKYLDLQNRFEIELSKLQSNNNHSAKNTNQTLLIPVAVHFPNVATNSTEKACLRQLAQNQIATLNADFNATNADISLWTPTVSAFYLGTNIGSINVKFVIANQNHSPGTGLANGELAVTFGTNFLNDADNDSQWIGYMNIVVRVAGGLGYSPLPGSPNEGATVVINYDAFGSGSGCVGYTPTGDYNLGRTLSHEIGHFFNLDHTFGNSLCNQSNTDDVNDTPQCTGSGGCPAAGSVPGCVTGQKSLTMNYMDYTDDACMYMLTLGQTTRMQAYLNVISNQFATNVLSNENFEFKNFALSPNPNNGTFRISFTPESNENIEIIVYDISGRKIHNKTFQNSDMFNQELQVNTISSSIYFVNIQNGENKMIKRIIIKN